MYPIIFPDPPAGIKILPPPKLLPCGTSFHSPGSMEAAMVAMVLLPDGGDGALVTVIVVLWVAVPPAPVQERV